MHHREFDLRNTAWWLQINPDSELIVSQSERRRGIGKRNNAGVAGYRKFQILSKMSKNDRLNKYKEKRDFRKSSEPSGDEDSVNKDKQFFVIQKHDASNLHYDFRLKIGDVLASWAVPKGPSTNPNEKRLAIQMEDHPLDYAKFEGIIPEGEYGAGAVIVWDYGGYKNLKEVPLQDQKDDGQIEVFLDGEKITGGYALIRIDDRGGEDSKWLLIKIDDDQADARRNPTSTEPKSVLSGKTIEDIKNEG